MLAGGQSSFSTVTVWHLEPNAPVEPPGAGIIGGYNIGPRFATLELTVPWSTDLSSVQLQLSQLDTVTGALGFLDATVYTSILGLQPMEIQTVSVPEPGTALLLLLPFAAAKGRWRQ